MANAGTTGVKNEEETEEQQQINAHNDDTTEQPKDDNYYPQDFYNEAVDDDDEAPEIAPCKQGQSHASICSDCDGGCGLWTCGHNYKLVGHYTR